MIGIPWCPWSQKSIGHGDSMAIHPPFKDTWQCLYVYGENRENPHFCQWKTIMIIIMGHQFERLNFWMVEPMVHHFEGSNFWNA